MFWTLTAYFNPCGYSSRLANYREFRRRLTIPLLVVEQAYGREFELQPGDADILVQLRGHDVLWQKERLLNVALGFLPPRCTGLAWLDCDVVLEQEDWAESAVRRLEHVPLLQLFRERCDLTRDAVPVPWRGENVKSIADSLGYKIATGAVVPDDLCTSDTMLIRRCTVGLAWAARREVLADSGLYDACVIGGGDRAILCAALGEFDHGVNALQMTARQAEHYLTWARPFFAAVQGKVGYIEGRIFHIWHGDLRERNYVERLQRLKQFGFDPFTDIAIADNGCWRWSSGEVEMHDYVRSYFDSRREDG